MGFPLTSDGRQQILECVIEVIYKKFYKPERLEPDWREAVERHRAPIMGSSTAEGFEKAMIGLSEELKTSHVGFFHESAGRASRRAALSATYLSDTTEMGLRWIFQGVHEGGAAARARIKPGDILLRVGGKEIIPPEHPTFAMGESAKIKILGADDRVLTTTVEVARPKGKRLHFVEPKLVVGTRLDNGVGYLKITMFPGMIGVEVANKILKQLDEFGLYGSTDR